MFRRVLGLGVVVCLGLGLVLRIETVAKARVTLDIQHQQAEATYKEFQDLRTENLKLKQVYVAVSLENDGLRHQATNYADLNAACQATMLEVLHTGGTARRY